MVVILNMLWIGVAYWITYQVIESRTKDGKESGFMWQIGLWALLSFVGIWTITSFFISSFFIF